MHSSKALPVRIVSRLASVSTETIDDIELPSNSFSAFSRNSLFSLNSFVKGVFASSFLITSMRASVSGFEKPIQFPNLPRRLNAGSTPSKSLVAAIKIYPFEDGLLNCCKSVSVTSCLWLAVLPSRVSPIESNSSKNQTDISPVAAYLSLSCFAISPIRLLTS